MLSSIPPTPAVAIERLARLLGHDAETTWRTLCSLGFAVSLPEVCQRVQQVQLNQSGLRRLHGRHQVAQRTPAWYDARHTMITASDVAQALGRGKFGTQRDFLMKKCTHTAAAPLSLNQCPPLRWGVKYEPVAQRVYCALTCSTVEEFGLVRHQTLDFLGASPDGVTDSGVMLEIKCPFRRQVAPGGDIPLQYYMQIQAQLEVCDLQECDYFECQVVEHSRKEFYERCTGTSTNPCFAGMVREQDGSSTSDSDTDSSRGGGPIFEYSDYMVTYAEQDDGCLATLQECERLWHSSHPASIVTYWTVDSINLVRVPRDTPFWQQILPQLHSVWQQVLDIRSGALPLPPTPPPATAVSRTSAQVATKTGPNQTQPQRSAAATRCMFRPDDHHHRATSVATTTNTTSTCLFT
jgi:putative phage-type endonuclease